MFAPAQTVGACVGRLGAVGWLGEMGGDGQHSLTYRNILRRQ